MSIILLTGYTFSAFFAVFGFESSLSPLLEESLIKSSLSFKQVSE